MEEDSACEREREMARMSVKKGEIGRERERETETE